MKMRTPLAIFALTGLALSCDPPPLGTVGKTLLAQAADSRELPKSNSEDSVEVELDKLDLATPPSAGEIRLAAGKRVPWSRVRDAAAALEKTGKRVVLLTARRRVIGGFELYEEVGNRPIEVVVRTDGNACVRLPGVREAKCVQRVDAKHVDRAHLRQLVREAIKVSKLGDVVVYVPPDMEWADVVRAVDAARTCCKKSMRPKVKLVDLETRDADPADETATPPAASTANEGDAADAPAED